MALNVGAVVSGYIIEQVLGEGGMGIVYRAAHPTLPRSDALKVLRSDFSADDQFRARFLREADLAATLDHPNIVAVHNRGESDGHLWIAMQFVQGTDADKELRDGRMTPARASQITVEVAKALDYAHRRNLLHRDVKPANFLLGANDERIFLADFGIARALDEAVGLTQTGMVMASVAYASPESLAGDAVDHRADIYSLGCSLYRLLTQKTPYARSGGMAAMAAAHLSQPPPRVTELAPALPGAIDAVVAKAMAKDPNQRYQTAGEFATAAARALDESTVEVRTRPAPPATQPWTPTPSGPTRPTPPPAWGPPPGPDAHTYPSGYFSGPNAQTPIGSPYGAPPGPPGPAPNKRRRLLIGGAVAAVVVVVAVVSGVLLFGGSSEPAYQSQSFDTVHGTTQITSRPKSVVALGAGDADAVLALGVQPVAIGAPNGVLPSWEQSAVTGSPKVLSFPDTAAVSALKPDVIIDTGDVDDATYQKLTTIAPTVTRPQANATTGWAWQTQLAWVGRILGLDDKAKSLTGAARSQQDDLKNQNPAFNGKSIEAVSVTDSGVSVVLSPSNTADYLESLGFRYSPDLQRQPTDSGGTRPVPDPSALVNIKTDVLVVIRTDRAAGQGGFAGLPTEFTAYEGIMIIADDANVIAALADPGGYLATGYLNSNFAPTIARQIK
jgi:eukaryotic-like serine/threonine-protein kinase